MVEVVRLVPGAEMRFGESVVPFGDAARVRLAGTGIEVILNTVRAQSYDPSLLRGGGDRPPGAEDPRHQVDEPLLRRLRADRVGGDLLLGGATLSERPGAHGLRARRGGTSGRSAPTPSAPTLRGGRRNELSMAGAGHPDRGRADADAGDRRGPAGGEHRAGAEATSTVTGSPFGRTSRPTRSRRSRAAQLAAGAVGINCQKLTEAEAFADAGFEDILVTYNVLGPAKLARLAALNARVPRLSVIADSPATVRGLRGGLRCGAAADGARGMRHRRRAGRARRPRPTRWRWRPPSRRSRGCGSAGS